MIFKGFRKKILGFFVTGVCSFGVPISYSGASENYLSNENNNLSLMMSENEISKMNNLNFKYDSNKNNYVYITELNKNEIAKNIAIYMLNEEKDYYDDALETLPEVVKKSFINNNIKNLKMSIAKEYEDIGWTFNMYYVSGIKQPEINNIYRLRIFQCPFLEYLKWNNIGNNQYTISFSLPTTWSIGSWEMTNDYVTNNDLVGTFIEMNLNPNIMTFSFGNIIFQKIETNISNFNYIDIDLMDLTADTLKNLFKLHNDLLPIDLNYSISLSNNLYLLNLKRVSYKIEENQNFTLYYEGNYTISFVESNYNFNWEIISTTYSLITVTDKDIIDNLILNKYYKNMIDYLVVEKNYDTNSAVISVNFDEKKYKNLVFYDFLKSYFFEKVFTVNFQQNIDITFKLLSNYEQILLNNFKEEYVTANFVYYSYPIEIIELASIEKNGSLNSVSFLAKLKIFIDGKNYFISVKGLIDNFEFFSFYSEEKIKKFIIENFCEDNELNYQSLKETLNKQSSWDYICNYSKNLLFKNIQIENKNENLEISLDIYNTFGTFLKSEKVQIVLDLKENENSDDISQSDFVENTENQKFNLNYLYFLFFLIPLFIVIFAVYKILNKKKQNKK